jgi:hypothetical protein
LPSLQSFHLGSSASISFEVVSRSSDSTDSESPGPSEAGQSGAATTSKTIDPNKNVLTRDMIAPRLKHRQQWISAEYRHNVCQVKAVPGQIAQ